MKKETAANIIEQGKQTYEVIAQDFSRTRQELWPILNLFKQYINDGDRILDVGCGNGRLIKIMQDKQVDYLGIDNSENLIKLAREQYPEYKFSCQDITELQADDQKYDVVFLVGVLHHVPSAKLRGQTLQNIYKLLKPGGHVLMTNWNLWQNKFFKFHLKYTWQRMIKQRDFEAGDILKQWGNTGQYRYLHGFTLRELKQLAKKNNFDIIKNEYVKPDAVKGTWRKAINILTILKKSN